MEEIQSYCVEAFIGLQNLHSFFQTSDSSMMHQIWSLTFCSQVITMRNIASFDPFFQSAQPGLDALVLVPVLGSVFSRNSFSGFLFSPSIQDHHSQWFRMIVRSFDQAAQFSDLQSFLMDSFSIIVISGCNVCTPQAESTLRKPEAGSAYRLSPQSPESKEARNKLWGITTHIQAKGSKFP